MARHEATFDVSSRADARAVRLLAERIHDTLREESHGVDRGSAEANAALQEFDAVREATSDLSPGTLTVVYESDEEPFEG